MKDLFGLMIAIADCSRVGVVATPSRLKKTTGASYSKIDRQLLILEKRNLVIYDEFQYRVNVRSRAYRLTPSGQSIVEYCIKARQMELPF